MERSPSQVARCRLTEMERDSLPSLGVRLHYLMTKYQDDMKILLCADKDGIPLNLENKDFKDWLRCYLLDETDVLKVLHDIGCIVDPNRGMSIQHVIMRWRTLSRLIDSNPIIKGDCQRSKIRNRKNRRFKK
jgi:hypothetical protein